MRPRNLLSWLMYAALAGCGGGDGWVVVGTFNVFDRDVRGTTDKAAHFSGTAFVPRGASCTFNPGPFVPPNCGCEVGPQAVGHWSNSATGAAGTLELTIFSQGQCVASETFWRSPSITLAPGANVIVLSLSDGVTQGSVSVTAVGR